MPATGNVVLVPFWNVTSTVSPTRRSRSFAGSWWTRMPPFGQALVAALDDVDVDELLEGEGSTAPMAFCSPSMSAICAAHGGDRRHLRHLFSVSATVGGSPWNDSSVMM